MALMVTIKLVYDVDIIINIKIFLVLNDKVTWTVFLLLVLFHLSILS